MIILGIETSCDETSVALVENGSKVIDQMISSQIKLHSRYLGVVPELASRAHLESINWMLEQILKSVPRGKKIKAIAVTNEPGLVGSLLVGHVTAECLSYAMDLPLIEVNHLEGHVFSPFLEKKFPRFPFLSLVVSGGHTDLVLVKGIGRFNVIGRTRDDACGEAYDKVAKLLGLGYPGGPVIDKMYPNGDPDKYALPRTVMQGSLDFSFSGLKTAVLYKFRELEGKNKKGVTKKMICDLAASFQKSAVGVLVKKTLKAAEENNLKTIALGGGVSANSLLRRELKRHAAEKKLNICLPGRNYCMDNAAMIASVGYYKYKFYSKKKKKFSVYAKKGVSSSAGIKNW